MYTARVKAVRQVVDTRRRAIPPRERTGRREYARAQAAQEELAGRRCQQQKMPQRPRRLHFGKEEVIRAKVAKAIQRQKEAIVATQTVPPPAR